jgi:hypothetical protein
MQNIREQIRPIHVRQQQMWLWQWVSRGLLGGGVLGCLVSLLRLAMDGQMSWVWVVVAVCLPLIASVAFAFSRWPTLHSAARQIDQIGHLKDRIQTALQFSSQRSIDPLQQLQIADAVTHLKSLHLDDIVTMRPPNTWPWGIVTTVMAVLMAFSGNSGATAVAAADADPVVAEQAAATAETLKELEAFQKEEQDPDLDHMLESMNRQIRELAAPGVIPKEAMAKLSEMEAELQAMQQKLSETTVSSQLKEIGDALSLADEMAQAGEALSEGNLKKAADELSQLDMPKLDRQTEKAISEKLAQIQEKAAQQPQKAPAVRDAVDKLAEGLSSQDQSKFQEGAEGLASEVKKQERKQQLSELLQKQSDVLFDAKSAMESELGNSAQGNKPGGTKAGKGPGNNPTADSGTAKQQTGPELKLKGQDSGTGDSEKATLADSQQESEAVRQYRQQAEQYESLNESVLESEAIPHGHRQTIRRYFEMIRPTPKELEAVDQKSAD